MTRTNRNNFALILGIPAALAALATVFITILLKVNVAGGGIVSFKNVPIN